MELKIGDTVTYETMAVVDKIITEESGKQFAVLIHLEPTHYVALSRLMPVEEELPICGKDGSV